jgi:hypothetical protein
MLLTFRYVLIIQTGRVRKGTRDWNVDSGGWIVTRSRQWSSGPVVQLKVNDFLSTSHHGHGKFTSVEEVGVL